MVIKGLDLYLNPTEVWVARSLGLEFEHVSAGGWYKILHCRDVEEREYRRRQIEGGVNATIEMEWRAQWNI